MKKISIYTNHYNPENFKINDLVKELSYLYEVDVTTQIPNYPKGKYFAGYNLFKKRSEVIGNISVKRLIVIPRGSSKIGLLLNYVSYIISSLIYSVYKSRVQSDIIFIYITSPIFISWSAIRHGKKQGIPLVMYLLDLWPDNLFSIVPIKSIFIRKLIENKCIKIYKQMDMILISSLSFKEVLISYGISEDKIIYFPQHEKLEEKYDRTIEDNSLSILFAGNIGEAQGLDLLVDVSKELHLNNILNIKFNIVGDGRYKDKLIANIMTEKVMGYFNFYPAVKQNELSKHYQQNDFGLVILGEDKTLNRHLPAKVQGYMANQLPIFALASDETLRIVELSNSGICVESKNSKVIVKALINMMETSQLDRIQYAENGYNYAKEHFDLKNQMDELEQIFESLTKK